VEMRAWSAREECARGGARGDARGECARVECAWRNARVEMRVEECA